MVGQDFTLAIVLDIAVHGLNFRTGTVTLTVRVLWFARVCAAATAGSSSNQQSAKSGLASFWDALGVKV